MAQGRIIAKQQEILECIKETILKKGYPPAVREICEAMKLKSTSSIHSHLEILEKNGYIRRDLTKPRTIEVTDECFNLTKRGVVNMPLVGIVTAGQLILVEENIKNYFPIPVEMLPNTQTFMLQVKDGSMINVDIYDGDQIITEEQDTARNSEIVVALVKNSTTVKRFFKENGHYRLQPENDTLKPITTDNVQIISKVVGSIRMM